MAKKSFFVIEEDREIILNLEDCKIVQINDYENNEEAQYAVRNDMVEKLKDEAEAVYTDDDITLGG